MGKFRPIIVCGPGNDGGTQVARWFQYNGVTMWIRERRPFGEDEDFTSADIDRLGGLDSLVWKRRMRRAALVREQLGRPWGYKDPRTSELIEEVVQLFPDAVYVRMRRKRGECIDSLLKQYGPSKHKRWRRGDEQAYTWAHELYDLREAELDRVLELAPVVTFDVDFSAVKNQRLGEIGCLPAVLVAATKDSLAFPTS